MDFFLTNLHKNYFTVIMSSLNQAKHSLYNIVYILMVNWCKRFLRPKAVRFLCNSVLRKTLLLCGGVEKNPEPFNTSKLSTFYKMLDPSQECLKFFLINALSTQNKYEHLSNLLQQLDSQTILIVTKTWISVQQDTDFENSNENLFL